MWMHTYLQAVGLQVNSWSIINLLLQTLEIINYVQRITFASIKKLIQSREYLIAHIRVFIYTHAISTNFSTKGMFRRTLE